MLRKLMRTLPRIQRFHFTLLLAVVGCMFFIEAFYISIRYGKNFSYLFDPNQACPKFEFQTGCVSYFARAGNAGKSSVICYNGTELVNDLTYNTVHIAYISSNTMNSQGSETFDVDPDSMLHLNLPLNTIFFLVTGNITHTNYLDRFMLINFNVTLPSWETQVAVVGWLEDTGRVYIHNMADNSTDAQVKGCLEMFAGLTTCGSLRWCPRGSVNFYVRGSSYKNSISSGICYNNTFIIRPGLNPRKGINALIINDKNLMVEELQTFNTHEDGETFDEYLRNVTGNKILILANEFEATKSLKDSSRKLLGEFGSTLIRLFDTKDSIIMVGQRGLYMGSALEKLQKRYVQGYPIISGCLNTRGIGMLRNLPPSPKIESDDTSKRVNFTCMMPSSCSNDSFPVSLFSGDENVILPKMCVNGEIINSTLLGRGINVAIFNTKSRNVTKLAVFDTFGSAETNIARNLSHVGEDDIVIAVTHDDGSARLTSSDKTALKRFGSYYIDQLYHRNSWYLIGRLNLDGYTPYEEIKFSFYKAVNTWSTPIDVSICIPFKFYGSIRPGVGPANVERREYCRMQTDRITSERDDLCSSLYSWQPLEPIMLQNPGVSKSPVFETPIFVLIGSNKVVAMAQLSSVLAMEGLNPENVFVMHDNTTTDHSQLIRLFKFNEIVVRINSTLDVYTSAINSSKIQHKSIVNDIIMLNDGVLATKHYLIFLANLYMTYTADPTICCISAYNQHGYVGISSFQKDLVYLVDDGPSLSYLIKSSFVREISSSGTFPKRISTLQPDVSRVVQHPLSPDFIPPYPSNVRSYARGQEVVPANVTHLTEVAYQKILRNLLVNAVRLTIDGLSCQFSLNQSNSSNVVSIFEQKQTGSISSLSKILRCFHISAKNDHLLVKGLYRGVFRFTKSASTSVFLVGSKSPYAKYLISDTSPVDQSPSNVLQPVIYS